MNSLVFNHFECVFNREFYEFEGTEKLFFFYEKEGLTEAEKETLRAVYKQLAFSNQGLSLDEIRQTLNQNSELLNKAGRLLLVFSVAGELALFAKKTAVYLYTNTWQKLESESTLIMGKVEKNSLLLFEEENTTHSLESKLTDTLSNPNELLKNYGHNHTFGLFEVKTSQEQKELVASPAKIVFNFQLIKKVVFVVLVAVLLFFAVRFIQNLVAKEQQKYFQSQIKNLNQEVVAWEKITNPEEQTQKYRQISAEINALAKKFPKEGGQIAALKNKLKKNPAQEITDTKKAELFFDLGLIDKKARADYANFNYGYLNILDKTNKKAYLINAKDKNYQTVSLQKIKNPQLLCFQEESLFVYDPKNGIYQINNNKAQKIISSDKDWKKVIDVQIFNNNLYLLDVGSDEIYKYGFSGGKYLEKQSYIRSGAMDMQNAKNITIDYNIYLLGKNGVYKFTSGLLQDNWTLDKKLKAESLTKIYKNEDNKKLFALDNQQAKLYLFSEKGALEKAYVNSKLKNVSFFAALSDKKIIFLKDGKIYSLDNL